MATINKQIGVDWTLLAAPTQAFLLSPLARIDLVMCVAATDTDAPPSADIVGHPLVSAVGDAMNRDLIGPGYVWARASIPVSAPFTAWTA